MALEKNFRIKKTTSTIVNKAYCRIDWLRFDQPDRVGFGVGVYEDRAAAEGGTSNRIDLINYETSADALGGKCSVNAAAAYAYAKSMDDWSDSVDVPEDGSPEPKVKDK